MFEVCTPNPDPGVSSAPAPCRDVVLILEDNEAISRMLAVVLAAQGLKAVCCALGGEALDRFREEPQRIALVLADCRLPDMDGRDVCHRLRTEQPGLPVLLTSGNVALRNLAPLADDRLVAFLPKPYTPAEIVFRVKALLQAARPVAA